MDSTIRTALEQDNLVDISTTGRRSGKEHRFEIWFHYHEKQIYLTGKPGPRDWYANILAQPEITFHLKESVQQDIPARGVPITTEPERRAILTALLQGSDYWDALERWIADSPLVRIDLDLGDL